MTIPSVPAGFLQPRMRGFLGCYPNKNELIAAPLALIDLGNFADYESVLGSSAPACSAVSGSIQVGLSWRKVRDETQAFLGYASTQDAIAWKAATGFMEKLRPLFLIAVTENPALAVKYPGLAQLFDAGKVAARLAAATRKKAAQAESRAAKKAAADEAAANAAAVKAAAATAAVPGTATKAVTDNA